MNHARPPQVRSAGDSLPSCPPFQSSACPPWETGDDDAQEMDGGDSSFEMDLDPIPLQNIDGAPWEEDSPADDIDLDLDETPFFFTREDCGLKDNEALQRRIQALTQRLEERLHQQVQLMVTDNSSTVFTFKQNPQGDGLQVRIHHMFLEAPDGVLDSLKSFICGGKTARRNAGKQLNAFIEERRELLREPPAMAFRPQRTTPVGKCRNLQDIFDSLNARFFDGKIQATIGWGRLPLQRNRRSIRFGVYSPRTRSIRIHPVLDTPQVPDFFVDYIVFHEMLHQAIPPKESGNGRQQIHNSDFSQAERRFPEYQRAVAWEKANLRHLLATMPLRKRRS